MLTGTIECRCKCESCGALYQIPIAQEDDRQSVDLPLWCEADFRGKVLWAVNGEHLDFLEETVAATLREKVVWGRTRISLHGAMPYHLPSWLLQPRTDRTFSASSRNSRRQSLPNGSCDSYRIRFDLAGGGKSGKRIADPSHLVKFHTGQSGCWQAFGFAYTFPRS